MVSFVDNRKRTIALYKCIQADLCGLKSYGPGQKHQNLAWATLSKSYQATKKNNESKDGDTITVRFRDYKYTPYIDVYETNLALTATIEAKKSNLDDIRFYVDGTLIKLPQYDVNKKQCTYRVTLNKDNSIVVNSDRCFSGYAREPSAIYEHGTQYHEDNVVIVKNESNDQYDYYRCQVPGLCSLNGYGPTQNYGSLAWILLSSNKFKK